eukprot:gene5556-9374_t
MKPKSTTDSIWNLPQEILSKFQELSNKDEELKRIIQNYLNSLHTEEQYKFFRQIGSKLSNKVYEEPILKTFISICTKMLFTSEAKPYFKHVHFIFTQNFKFSINEDVFNKLMKINFDLEMSFILEKIHKVKQNDQNFENYLKVLENFISLKEMSFYSNFMKEKVFSIFQKFVVLLEKFITKIKNEKQQQTLIFYFNSSTLMIRAIQILFSKFNDLFMDKIKIDAVKVLSNDLEVTQEFQILSDNLFFILKNQHFSRDSKKYSGLVLCSLMNFKEFQKLSTFYYSSFNYKNQVEITEEDRRRDVYINIVLLLDEKIFNYHLNQISNISTLSILNGILSIHNEDVHAYTIVTNENEKRNLLFDLIFPMLFKISSKLHESTEVFFLFQTIHTGIQSFKKIIQKYPTVEHLIPSILKKILDIIWNNWENPISNVFELMKKFFDNIMEIYDLLTEDNQKRFQLAEITSQLISTNWNFKGKYPSLSQIIPRLGAYNLYKRFPKILHNILTVVNSRIVVSQAANLYNDFINHLYKEIDDITEFKNICLKPIIEAIIEDEEKLTPIIQYIFPTIFKVDKTNLSFILKEIDSKFEHHSNVDQTKYIKTVLLILKSAKPLGILQNEMEEHANLLSLAFNHYEEDLKLIALETLVLNPKSSEPLTKFECELLKKFFSLNLNHCSSAFLSRLNNNVMKKLFNQIKNSTYKSWKSIEQLKKEKKPKTKKTEQKKEEKQQETKRKSTAEPSLHKSSSLTPNKPVEDSEEKSPIYGSKSIGSKHFDLIAEEPVKPKSIIEKLKSKDSTPKKSSNASVTSTISLPEQTKREREKGNSPPLKKKKVEKVGNPNDLSDTQYGDLLSLQGESSIQFLEFILQIIKQNLYPGSPSDKKMFALSLYKMMIQNFSDEKSYQINPPQNFNKKMYWTPLDLFPSNLSKLLQNSFLDNFDKIRVEVYEVLMLFPKPIPLLSQQEEISEFINAANRLLNVGRLRESDSGALMIRLLFSKYISKSNVFIEELCQNESKETNNTINFFEKLLKNLRRKTELCEKDLSNILQNPLIGNLTTLKYCLKHLKANDSEWKSIAVPCLKLLFQIQKLTSKVVSSIDDENFQVDCRGHLFSSDEEKNQQNNHSLVVNCWLALVECCESIGIISSTVELPVYEGTLAKDAVLSIDQFKEIGDAFISIFITSKHNGVIEKGALSFNKICKRLLNCGINQLCTLPSKWLDIFLSLIKEDKKNVLRRSAGLPWAIMAILTSEPAGVPKVLLPRTMKFFLDICETDDKSPKVHSLHVLSFIFRESSLSEFILHHIEDGFIVVLKGFNSQHWNVRNSSLMCFNHLINRAIPHVGSNDSSSSNAITSTVFFSRYPKLRDYLLKLTQEVKSSSDLKLHPSLYPVLLLLSKLRPPVRKNFEENVSIDTFLPYVKEFLGHNYYLVRSISSIALIPLVTISETPQFITALFEDLAKDYKKSTNEIHGHLLTILEFLKSLKGSVKDKEIVSNWFHSLEKIFFFISNHCPLIPQLYFEIFLELTKLDQPSQKFLHKIHQMSLKLLQLSNFGISMNEMKENAATVSLLSSKLIENSGLLQDTIIKLIHHENVKVRIKTQNFLENCEVTPKIKSEICNLLMKEMNVLGIIRVLKSFHKFDVVPHDFNKTWERLMKFYNHSNHYIKEESIVAMGSFLSKMSTRDPKSFETMISSWKEILLKEIKNLNDFNVRLACVKSIEISKFFSFNNKDIPENKKKEPIQFTNENLKLIDNMKIIFFKILIEALQDETNEIREYTTRFLSPFVSSTKIVFDELFVLENLMNLMLNIFLSEPNTIKEIFEYFFEKLTFKKKNQSEIELPFDLNFEEKLFDKESDNIFKEEIFEIQLFVYNLQNLMKNHKLDDDLLKRYQNDHLEQSKQILSSISSVKSNFYWKDGITYDKDVHIALNKILLSSLVLSNKEEMTEIIIFGVVFDIDGVLYKDYTPIPGALESLQKIKELKIPHILLTNSGGKTEEEKLEILHQIFETTFELEQLVLAHTPLKEIENKSGRTLVIGKEKKHDMKIMENYGYSDTIFIEDYIQDHIYLFPTLAKGIKPLENLNEKPIENIVVIGVPKDWLNSLQCLLDILSSDGRIGFESDTQVVKIIFSNPDVVYAGFYKNPRITEGSFRETIQHLYEVVHKKKLNYQLTGKPTDFTFSYAKKVLNRYAEKFDVELEKIYMIGDNLDSDIIGANLQGDEWVSVLVKTGLCKENSEKIKADFICDDVREAVKTIFSKHNVEF